MHSRSWPRETKQRMLLFIPVILITMACSFSPCRLSEEGPPPFVGPLAPNNILSKGRIILQGQVLGPESFAVDSKGG